MFGRLALHTWTLDTTPLREAITAAKAGGFDAIELRRLDFVRAHEQGIANEAVLDIVRAGGMPVHMLGSEHGWLFAKGEESRRLFDVMEESCENAVALDCPVLMTAAGRTDGPIAEGIENFKRAADICGKYGLRLAFEFNAGHPSINRIAPALEIIHGADRPNAGILLDTYHLERGGDGGAGFADVAPQDIFAFQFSDVPEGESPNRPTDRLPAGQGVVPWINVLRLLHQKGFEGYLSYEAPNPDAWARPPVEVCREASDAMRAMIAKAVGASTAANS
jgi:sugar phosphate isomerase/epimerase